MMDNRSTKMQYVYMLRSGSNHYKIGVTANVRKRVVGIQTSNANKIELVVSIFIPNANEIETQMHQILHDLRSGGGTEWFKLEPDKAIEVAILLSSYSLDVSAILSDKFVLKKLLEENRSWKKSLEKKLDIIVNNYQRIEKKSKVSESVAKTQKKQLRSDDELYLQAIDLCKKRDKASTSMLQRHLKIGYGRAARLMDKMENEGLVSETEGSVARAFIGTS